MFGYVQKAAFPLPLHSIMCQALGDCLWNWDSIKEATKDLL